ncbi:hypothetical protein C8R45DRAFT_843648, partial [Mycena sanguinolenta]
MSAAETSQAGRKPPAFITNNFTHLGKQTGKTGCYDWKCNHCGDDDDSKGTKLEGRDNILPNHISDSRQCLRAPSNVRSEALRFMADKKKAQSTDQDDAVIDVDATEALTETVPCKKRRALQGSLDGYVDQAMTTGQKNSADRKSLRFLIHANVPLQSAENPYLSEFLHDLRPSYNAPKRYSL